MAEVIYVLCALTSGLCTVLLWRSWQRTRTPLLLWSSLCFVGLFLNNLLLFVDLVMTPPELDLSIVRTIPALLGVVALLYGLVCESS